MNNINIKFPDGNEKNFEKGKPIVLLGANGSGKTRLSVKIEELNDQNFSGVQEYDPDAFLVHRISAQKSLSLDESIVIKGFESSEMEAFTGSDRPRSNKIGFRYRNNPVTNLLDDYNHTLALFFAKDNQIAQQYLMQSNLAKRNGKTLPDPPTSLIEMAEKIWSYLLPNRQIDLSGNEVYVNYNGQRYHGKEMSDGERVILYMIVQALSVRKNSLIIIDEPELHIHKAILGKLWDKLEEVRQDCVFMYITHDLDFAVSRKIDEVLWVKSYHGNEKWEYEFLPLTDYDELPEGLLFEILGTQKRIIFVEGTKNSLDYLMYQEIYKHQNFHIIPCGGCSQVINYVKAKQGYSKFGHIEIYGIIDKDFRTDHEIASLKEDNIFVLEVAEVENLFLVPELLNIVSERLGIDSDDLKEVKMFVIELYKSIKKQQIFSAFSQEVNHQLSTTYINETDSTEDVANKITEKFSTENIKKIMNEKEEYFDQVKTYEDILKAFNFKELPKKVAPKLGIDKNRYKPLVLHLLQQESSVREKVLEALSPYVPELPME